MQTIELCCGFFVLNFRISIFIIHYTLPPVFSWIKMSSFVQNHLIILSLLVVIPPALMKVEFAIRAIQQKQADIRDYFPIIYQYWHVYSQE